MVRISETFAPNKDPVDWPRLKHQVIAALDVCSEYEALGVRFSEAVVSIKGWRECHAIDRPDENPSAAVNVLTGLYHDQGGSGSTQNFFDFALKHGNWGTWIDCVRHYAEKAGVEVGEIKRGSRGAILEQVYQYEDADRNVRYGVHRLRQQSGAKDFRQYPLKNGEWVKEKGCMDGVEALPYRLPDVLESAEDEPILIVEGEKDVDRVWEDLGLVATCHHGGAKNVGSTYPDFINLLPKGRDYYVVPDNDDPGRACARRVCDFLNPIAKSVRYLALPGVPYKGDLSDWLDLGGDVDELGKLMAKAPIWSPEKADEIEKAGQEVAHDEMDDDATAADLIQINTTIRWVIPNWIPQGVLTALAAEPGVGKTRLGADLLRIVANGVPQWPDGTPNELPAGGRALWVAADNQHPELGSFPAEFGFEPSALVLNSSRRNPFGGTMLDSEDDLREFEARINRIKPVFVFIDTTLNATDRSSNKPEDAKAFFKPLQEIAARTQTAIVCITHLNADGKPLGRRIQGQCRVVISMSRPDPDNQPHRRKLWVSKSNSLYPAALGVTMATGGNTYDFHPPEPPPENESGQQKGKTSKKAEECAVWLKKLLKGTPGALVKDVRSEAETAGYNAPTLYKAKDMLGIEEDELLSRKRWKLPNAYEDDPVVF